MCDECRRIFIAGVVSDNTDQAYRGFIQGGFGSVEEAASSLIQYAGVQYEMLVKSIGDPCGGRRDDNTRH